jgi:ATP-binding cassette subfamily F protein 3
MLGEHHSTILAALYNAGKFYGGQTILDGATLELRPASRVALIGRNGAGKSTILRLLSGSEEADGGRVYRRPHTEIGMLDQELQLNPGTTIFELSDQAFAHLDLMEAQLQELEAAGLDDPERFERWEELHQRFEWRGGYARRSRRDAVLNALGFGGRGDDLVQVLSGGEKTRLGLARLLMAQPDLLLLDEPTNHLDMEMRDWLSGHLARYTGATLIVSHDRAFLEGSCQQTAEISQGTLRNFDGPPSAWRSYRAEQERIEAATRLNQQKEHERLESAAAQMKQWAGQNAKLHRRARAMERRTERFEDTMLPDAEAQQRTTRFRFPSGPSGDIVLQAEHLTRVLLDGEAQGDGPVTEPRTLFEDVKFTLRQGDRVALLGPNGAGKTTLFRMLLGDLPSDDGRANLRFGARVRVGYYDQELRDVDPEHTLIEELIRLVGDRDAHNLLGRFMFPYDAQYKQIRSLSGGEKARLALLKLTLGENNFLVLDEPTNHLDVEMIEALEEALLDYDGTLLLVSHDRSFVSRVASVIWELKDGRLVQFAGDYDYYRHRQAQQRNAAAGAVPVKPPARRPAAEPAAAADAQEPRRVPGNRWQLQQRLERLEHRIPQVEQELEGVTLQLEDPSGLTAGVIGELAVLHDELDLQLLELLGEWEAVTDTLEQLERAR